MLFANLVQNLQNVGMRSRSETTEGGGAKTTCNPALFLTYWANRQKDRWCVPTTRFLVARHQSDLRGYGISIFLIWKLI